MLIGKLSQQQQKTFQKQNFENLLQKFSATSITKKKRKTTATSKENEFGSRGVSRRKSQH